MQPKPLSQKTTLKRLLAQIFRPDKLKRCLMLAVIPSVLCYAFLLTGLTSQGFSITESLRDAMQQTEVSSWLGLISNVGVFLMVSTAVICFFSISLPSAPIQRKQRECLLLMGLLSACLAVDDFFLLHDRYINEHILYATYAFCLAALLYRHATRIFNIDAPAFFVAGTLLALSIFTDVIQDDIPFSYEQVQIFEEGFKFAGMATWLYFGYRMASNYLAPNGGRA